MKCKSASTATFKKTGGTSRQAGTVTKVNTDVRCTSKSNWTTLYNTAAQRQPAAAR